MDETACRATVSVAFAVLRLQFMNSPECSFIVQFETALVHCFSVYSPLPLNICGNTIVLYSALYFICIRWVCDSLEDNLVVILNFTHKNKEFLHKRNYAMPLCGVQGSDLRVVRRIWKIPFSIPVRVSCFMCRSSLGGAVTRL